MFKTEKGRRPTNINENNKSASIREKKNSNCLIRRTEGGTSNIVKITNQASDRNKNPCNGNVGGPTSMTVTKNRCVTHVKIRGYANLVSSLLAYSISAVALRFCNSILSRFRMSLQIVCYCNVTLFSIAGKF